MASGNFLFTSESVSMGHPDKVSDQVSDGILDALLAQDPMSRVACETMCTTDLVVLAGEITSNAKVDYVDIARNVIRGIGYTSDDIGFNADSCRIFCALHSQSADIAMGVDRARQALQQLSPLRERHPAQRGAPHLPRVA